MVELLGLALLTDLGQGDRRTRHAHGGIGGARAGGILSVECLRDGEVHNVSALHGPGSWPFILPQAQTVETVSWKYTPQGMLGRSDQRQDFLPLLQRKDRHQKQSEMIRSSAMRPLSRRGPSVER